jgi:hypothetical protein
MADQQPPAQAPAAETSDKTHTDPVTGEKISKSELKRRQKQREKDEKKKEKEAALPARPKKDGKKDDVEELNPNVRVSHPIVASCLTICSNTLRFAQTRSTPFAHPSSQIPTLTSSTSITSSQIMYATSHISPRARRSRIRRFAWVSA